MGVSARTITKSGAPAATRIGGPVSRAGASAAVERVAVIKRPAPGIVPGMVIYGVVVMPIESPMPPAPSKAAVPSDSEADTKRQIRPAIPDAGVRIPARPRHDRTSVDQPWIVRGDVDDFGTRWFNGDRRTLRRYGLLRRALQIAGRFRFLPHDLHGIHDVLFLVVVGVAE